MTEPGKNAPGLKGFPTPNEAADVTAYLLLYFQDETWAQYALGALKVLTVAYNWYESGDLDVDEAAEAFRLIVQQAPLNKLPSCSLPTGEPLMRIDPETGHIQDVDGDGNWQDDADLPPTPARPHSTPVDMRCLAAANAANALQILYESLSDSWNSGLSTAEAITAFITAVGEAIAVEFFPPAAALIAIGGLLFQVVYQVVAFVGADVWTGDFTAQLQCYLFDCASVDDADVVTFDFQCVIDKLAKQTNVFDLSFTQLRLFGQLYYILNFIGVDGLNFAGSATAITTADCTSCGCTGTSVEFGDSDAGFALHGWGAFAGVGTYMTNIFGTGWYLDTSGGFNQLGISGVVDRVCGTGINFNITLSPGAPITPAAQIRVTTSTQVKNATFTPVNGVNNVVWDEGGELDEDSGTVEIGYIGASGYGGMVASFQTGEV